jgi:hypothetical protein
MAVSSTSLFWSKDDGIIAPGGLSVSPGIGNLNLNHECYSVIVSD